MNVWQLVLGCVTAVASITAAILSWRAGRSTIDQRENQARREEWWRRFQWATELALSDEQHRAQIGVALLGEAAQNSLASDDELRAARIALEVWLTTIEREVEPPYTGSSTEEEFDDERRTATQGLPGRYSAGIVYFDQRLGERTPDWIMKLASTRLPFDPVDQETWSPLASSR